MKTRVNQKRDRRYRKWEILQRRQAKGSPGRIRGQLCNGHRKPRHKPEQTQQETGGPQAIVKAPAVAVLFFTEEWSV